MKDVRPPKHALRFLRWFCREDYVDEIEGDLTEIFKKQHEHSPSQAKWAFAWSVIKYFRPDFIKRFKSSYQPESYSMIKSYFKIGWRSLLRAKGYSFINISGLAMGMSVALLIGLWVHNELNYNKSFDNYARIGSVQHNINFGDQIITHDGVPHPYGEELKKTFAEFDEVVTYMGPQEHIVGLDEKKISRTCYYVEPSFMNVFSFPLVEGTRSGLNETNSIMLAKSLADALVGGNALGKLIKFDNRDQLVVTGVFEDFPANSHFADVKILAPLNYYLNHKDEARGVKDNWRSLDAGCFVLLNEKASWAGTGQKIKSFLFEKTAEDLRTLKPEAVLHPMSRWNLYADFKEGKNTGGKIQFVWMFGAIGGFVLLLACINFMNLSTARSERRSKEVGIRKVMGSLRNQLVNQFMSESLLVVAIAFIITVSLVFLLMPAFNNLAGTAIQIPWSNPYFIGVSVVFIFLTGLLAGSYPALYLSSFNPIKVLKGTFRMGRNSTLSRKALVVFQFTISTVLIIGTGIVFQQIQHAKNRPAGFDLEGIIYTWIKTEDLTKANYNSLRHDLLATGVVENMAKSDFPITGGMSGEATITWEGKDPAEQALVAMNRVSHDFPAATGFQFVEGRDFSRDYTSDSLAVVINEMAAKLFSLKGSAIGKKIKWGSKGIEREIIGVIKDQIRWTPFVKQSPHVYHVGYQNAGVYTVRLKPTEGVHSALLKIESVFKKYDPGSPFDYKFVDEDYAHLFKTEERIGSLASVFASLAILISCIGIFGLASFAASQRTKEIGIRKVMGASVFKVWKMLSKDFVWLMAASIALSCPIAYYYANNWLQQYEYRIEISWQIFALTGIALFAITLITVSYQSIKAAMANPVDSLRSE